MRGLSLKPSLYYTSIMLLSPFAHKEEELKALFASCLTAEAKYEKIIALGKELPPFDAAYKTPGNLVEGCQSVMYLKSEVREGVLFFSVYSEALISKGLAALLLHLYQGESAETVFKNPPSILQELGILQTLTPGRSNGLAALYLRMKQEALNSLFK